MKNQRRNSNRELEPARIRDKRRTIATLKRAARELLVSKGVSGASVQPILDKAGVSRGALFHHFPTKNHLIAVAFDDLMHNAAIELHILATEYRLAIISVDEFVDGLRAIYCSDVFIGSMEIALNHRVDPTLSELIESTIDNWWVSLSAFWNDTFELPGLTQTQAEQHWEMAANLLRGHAFTSIYRSSDSINADFCASFKQIILSRAQLRPFKDRFDLIAEDFRKVLDFSLFIATSISPPNGECIYSSAPEIYPSGTRSNVESSPWWQQFANSGQTWLGHDQDDLLPMLPEFSQIVSSERAGCITIPVMEDNKIIGSLNLLSKAHAYTREVAARAELFARRAVPLFRAVQNS